MPEPYGRDTATNKPKRKGYSPSDVRDEPIDQKYRHISGASGTADEAAAPDVPIPDIKFRIGQFDNTANGYEVFIEVTSWQNVSSVSWVFQTESGQGNFSSTFDEDDFRGTGSDGNSQSGYINNDNENTDDEKRIGYIDPGDRMFIRSMAFTEEDTDGLSSDFYVETEVDATYLPLVEEEVDQLSGDPRQGQLTLNIDDPRSLVQSVEWREIELDGATAWSSTWDSTSPYVKTWDLNKRRNTSVGWRVTLIAPYQPIRGSHTFDQDKRAELLSGELIIEGSSVYLHWKGDEDTDGIVYETGSTYPGEPTTSSTDNADSGGDHRERVEVHTSMSDGDTFVLSLKPYSGTYGSLSSGDLGEEHIFEISKFVSDEDPLAELSRAALYVDQDGDLFLSYQTDDDVESIQSSINIVGGTDWTVDTDVSPSSSGSINLSASGGVRLKKGETAEVSATPYDAWDSQNNQVTGNAGPTIDLVLENDRDQQPGIVALTGEIVDDHPYIEWGADDDTDEVKVEYSTDGGTTWSTYSGSPVNNSLRSSVRIDDAGAQTSPGENIDVRVTPTKDSGSITGPSRSITIDYPYEPQISVKNDDVGSNPASHSITIRVEDQEDRVTKTEYRDVVATQDWQTLDEADTIDNDPDAMEWEITLNRLDGRAADLEVRVTYTGGERNAAQVTENFFYSALNRPYGILDLRVKALDDDQYDIGFDYEDKYDDISDSDVIETTEIDWTVLENLPGGGTNVTTGTESPINDDDHQATGLETVEAERTIQLQVKAKSSNGVVTDQVNVEFDTPDLNEPYPEDASSALEDANSGYEVGFRESDRRVGAKSAAQQAGGVPATKAEVDGLIGSLRVAKVNQTLSGAEVTKIEIIGPRTQLPKGTHLQVINKSRGRTSEVVTSETEETYDDGILNIESQRVYADPDDPIILDGSFLAAGMRVMPDQVKSMVVQGRKGKFFTTLTSDISGSVSSLPVESTDGPLADGDILILVEQQMTSGATGIFYGGTVFDTATVNGDVSSGSTSIPINAKTLDFNSGAGVRVTDNTIVSTFDQQSTSISLRVKSSEQMSELTVNLESITVDTNIFKTDNWDGSVDSSGNITSFATVQSWALTGAGHFNLRLDNLAFEVDGSGFTFDTEPGNDDVGVSINVNGLQIFNDDPGGASGALEFHYLDASANSDQANFFFDNSGQMRIDVTGGNDLSISAGTMTLGGTALSAPDDVTLATNANKTLTVGSTLDASNLPDIGNAGTGELGVDSNGFVKRA